MSPLSRAVLTVWIRLPADAASLKRVVGNPVRAPILAVRKNRIPIRVAGGRLNILVIGGSQGARLFGESDSSCDVRCCQMICARGSMLFLKCAKNNCPPRAALMKRQA